MKSTLPICTTHSAFLHRIYSFQALYSAAPALSRLMGALCLFCLGLGTTAHAQDFVWVRGMGGSMDEVGYSIAVKIACFALTFLFSFFIADLSFGSTPYTIQTAPPRGRGEQGLVYTPESALERERADSFEILKNTNKFVWYSLH